MNNLFNFDEARRKRIAKKSGLTEFQVYLNSLIRTAVGRFVEKDPNEIKAEDHLFELCQGDKEKLDYIFGTIQATLDVDSYSSEWNEENPFALYPTVFSLMVFFDEKAAKQNKQILPSAKFPPVKEEQDESSNHFLF